ncbi:MAG: TonB family protein [candidate division NC10 bacterium]|nr:TonB family protein [candidate division NC10 bacterium]
MAGWKRREKLREIGERLTGTLETVLTAWERSRLLFTYTRLRRRISGPPLPGVPETADLDPYVFFSLGLHILAALLIYLLAARAIPLAERPPISIRILETKAEAPSPARQEITPQAERKAPQKPPAALPKPQPAPPQPVEKPIFTPKTLPRMANVDPLTPNPAPKALPKDAPTVQSSKITASDVPVPDKGLLPKPVTPFQAESPPASAPRETPRSLGASVPEAPPAEIRPLPAPSTATPATTQAPAPLELRETTLGGFRQPTGPVVVPERFLKGGRPDTAPAAGEPLIDTSDPDFTEYFEQVKRRVYATWRYPEGVRGVHEVWLRFTLDRAGASQGVQVVRSNNAVLNASAVEAMHRASPFPPIPEKFRALVGQPLILKFTVTIQ